VCVQRDSWPLWPPKLCYNKGVIHGEVVRGAIAPYKGKLWEARCGASVISVNNAFRSTIAAALAGSHAARVSIARVHKVKAILRGGVARRRIDRPTAMRQSSSSTPAEADMSLRSTVLVNPLRVTGLLSHRLDRSSNKVHLLLYRLTVETGFFATHADDRSAASPTDRRIAACALIALGISGRNFSGAVRRRLSGSPQSR